MYMMKIGKLVNKNKMLLQIKAFNEIYVTTFEAFIHVQYSKLLK